MPTKPRKRNPNDATFRNVRALKTRMDTFSEQISDLLRKYAELHDAIERLQDTRRVVDGPVLE